MNRHGRHAPTKAPIGSAAIDEASSSLEAQAGCADAAFDIDLLVARHRKVIRSLPKGEANKLQRLRTCAAMDSEIAGLIETHGPLVPALVLHANLAMELRDWPAAVRRWEKVAERSAGHRALAHLKTAGVHRNTGDLHSARLALHEAEKAGIDTQGHSYAKEKKAVNNAINAWMSARLIQDSVTEVKKGQQENAISLLRAGLFLKGTDARIIAFAESVFHEFVRMAGKETDSTVDAAAPEMHPPLDASPVQQSELATGSDAGSVRGAPALAVFTCGFGWSGSGAVTDYLREFAPVSLPFGTTELGCFENARSILRVKNGRRAAMRDALVNYFLLRVLGVARETHGAKARQKVETNSLIRFFGGSQQELDELRIACVSAFDSIWEASTSADQTERIVVALRTLFDRMLRAKLGCGRMVLLNNAIHGHAIELIRLVPSARALVVIRDPRDQLVSQLIEARNSDVDEFVHNTRVRLDECRKALENPDVSRHVEVLRFEDFVSSAEVRRAVLDRLDLAEADRNGKQHFFPEQSQQNVGIYRDHPDQKVMERIREELAPHLIEPTL